MVYPKHTLVHAHLQVQLTYRFRHRKFLGTGAPEALALLEPLFKDSVAFVRQGALIALALIMMQQNAEHPKFKMARELFMSTMVDKHEVCPVLSLSLSFSLSLSACLSLCLSVCLSLCLSQQVLFLLLS